MKNSFGREVGDAVFPTFSFCLKLWCSAQGNCANANSAMLVPNFAPISAILSGTFRGAVQECVRMLDSAEDAP
ncbi:hypothetical protein [Erythrobacter sp. JK5]|uniref:hypothetical protein n=1 Tax=Erythrobacter sp. JK5 TaxID=2829500 RepID=UPI001BA5E790|nr:hypothetical protein [Erythrobacter sp. JK5]QUL37049.1 hypothetical protein KDC96_11680 [Erythrobacter sp. JK5]